MRVVAGEFRGMRLIGPKDEKIRPTMDRAKEGLFNVINQDIYDAKFLDLFAGTGSIGIEAISRGANSAILVDMDRESIRLINENTKKMNEKITIIRSDVNRFINSTSTKFDYIFMDPPYDIEIDSLKEIVGNIYEQKILSEHGILIIELKSKKELEFDNFDTFKFKRYGISGFSFLKVDNE